MTTLTPGGQRPADTPLNDSPEIKAFRTAALDAIQNLRHLAAGNFTPAYSGSLGEARCNSFYEAYQAVRTLPAPQAATSLALDAPPAGGGDLETELLWPVGEEMERLEADLRDVGDELSATQGDAASYLALAQSRIRIVMDLVEAVSRPPRSAGSDGGLREAVSKVLARQIDPMAFSIGEGEKWDERRARACKSADALLAPIFAVLPATTLARPDPREQAAAGVGALEAYLIRQWGWSKETFGPALRTKGVIQHIAKELREIEAKPHDLSEWVDVIILAMDGFWRHGGKPQDLLPVMQAKQDKNFARTWPDWRTVGEDSAIEHDRSGEAAQPNQTPEAAAPSGSVGEDREAIAARLVRAMPGMSLEDALCVAENAFPECLAQQPAPQAPVADAAGVGRIPFQTLQAEPTPPEEAKRLLVQHAKNALADVLLKYAPQFDYDNAAMADALFEAGALVDAALAPPQAARSGDGELREALKAIKAIGLRMRLGAPRQEQEWKNAVTEMEREAEEALPAPVQADAAEGRS